MKWAEGEIYCKTRTKKTIKSTYAWKRVMEWSSTAVLSASRTRRNRRRKSNPESGRRGREAGNKEYFNNSVIFLGFILTPMPPSIMNVFSLNLFLPLLI